MTGLIEAYGNIQSLMNFSDSCTEACYINLFSGCTTLITPPDFLATTLAPSCYRNMFNHCISLTAFPFLNSKDIYP